MLTKCSRCLYAEALQQHLIYRLVVVKVTIACLAIPGILKILQKRISSIQLTWGQDWRVEMAAARQRGWAAWPAAASCSAWTGSCAAAEQLPAREPCCP